MRTIQSPDSRRAGRGAPRGKRRRGREQARPGRAVGRRRPLEGRGAGCRLLRVLPGSAPRRAPPRTPPSAAGPGASENAERGRRPGSRPLGAPTLSRVRPERRGGLPALGGQAGGERGQRGRTGSARSGWTEQGAGYLSARSSPRRSPCSPGQFPRLLCPAPDLCPLLLLLPPRD